MGFITNDKEAFLFMREHLLNQMEKSISQDSECTYRGYKQNLLDQLKDEAETIAEHNGFYDEEDVEDVYIDLLASHSPTLKCAVGALIIDTFYHQNLEGRVVSTTEEDIVHAVQKSNPLWKITDMSISLMQEFQNIHDRHEPSEWGFRTDRLFDRFDYYNDYTGVPK